MSGFRLLKLDAVRSLRDHVAAWNDLWARSDTASPSARAEQIALWLDRFAAKQAFCALVAADGARFVAALPLVTKRIKQLVRVGALPANEWTSGGDLLVDPAADVPAALDCLCQGIADVPWPLLWLDDVDHAAPRWTALVAALGRAHLTCDIAPQYRVGQVAVSGAWADYEATRDGDHRRSRRRYTRRLHEMGKLRLDLHHGGTNEALDHLVDEGFRVEDRSWKGAEGTSVLKNGLLDFFQAQARELAAAGLLELAFLKLEEQPLAFAYCWRAKGMRFMAKLGYDEAFRQYGPGQQLVMHYLEALHAADDCRVLDFWGRLMPWSESWATGSYEVARIVVAPPRLTSRGALRAYEALRKRAEV